VPNADDQAAQLIADNAADLSHPDGMPCKLPTIGSGSQVLPPAMREAIAADLNQRTKRIGEAVVHTLRTKGGFTIIRTSELEQLRAKAGLAGDVPVHCSMAGCDELLFTLNSGSGKIATHGPALIRHLHGRSPQCPHAVVL
jgi:hypothetical protein